MCHSHGLEYDVTVWTDRQTVVESVDSIVIALRTAGCLPGGLNRGPWGAGRRL